MNDLNILCGTFKELSDWVPKIKDLHKPIWGSTNEKQLCGKYPIEEVKWVLATRNEELLGFCSIVKTENDYHLFNLLVAPSYRRQGIGEKIIKYVQEQAIKDRVKEVFLFVNNQNSEARNLYEKLGFKISDETED